MKIIGYHGTTEENGNNIIESQEYKYDESRNHWMGDGIYFFEDPDLAEQWANDMVEKEKKEKKAPMVLVNTLHCENDRCLDLTKLKNKDKFRTDFTEFFNELKTARNGGLVIGDESTSKKEVLSLYYNYLKKQNGYDIIINTFVKKNTKYATTKMPKDFNLSYDLFTGLSFVEVQICASNNSVIKEIQYYSKEEEI